jgi:predicted SprT family Zn-dependent metalloprotease
VVLLHELTHYIIDRIYVGHEDHGKQFAGVYMHLLDKYRIIPSIAFRAIAKKHRVKIAGKFKPGAIGLDKRN